VPGRFIFRRRLGLIGILVRFLGQAPKVCSSRPKESTDDSPSAALAPWQEPDQHWQSTQQTPPPVLFAGTQVADLLHSGLRLRACAKTLTHTLVRSCRAIFQLPCRRRLFRLKRHKQFLRQRTRWHMAVATNMPVASYFTT
jgi:hypothetical protein